MFLSLNYIIRCEKSWEKPGYKSILSVLLQLRGVRMRQCPSARSLHSRGRTAWNAGRDSSPLETGT